MTEPEPNARGSERAERTLVVWCPDWPVVAAQAGDGSVVPVAVVLANRIVACSAAARAAGVHRGLRRREGQARCPDLVVVEHDPGRDARAFEPVVAAVEAFCVGVEVVRPGLCALATLGPSRYFGGDEALAHQVVSVVERGCRVGVADGVFAAGLAAREGPVVVVPPGEAPTFLAPFPVSVLERPELADLLRRLGVETLGQLATLPAPDVLGRFGSEGLEAHRLARGLEARPLAARQPPPELVAVTELDPPIERVEAVAFVGKSLADSLVARLDELGLACTRVRIEAETEHGESLVRLWRAEGALTAGAMAERVRWQLEGWLSGPDGPTAGITLLRLVPDQVGPAHGRQLGFWGGSAAAAERAARGLARVQGLLGPDAVVTAVIGGGRGPGDRVTLVPWGDERLSPPSGSSPWPGSVPAPAPALVYPRPGRPVSVESSAGQPVAVTGRGMVTAPPARFALDGGTWIGVTAWAGPWPVDERWWDPTGHCRRARFQVVGADGVAWLLAVERGRWWAEARYD